jgi:hypothetical protein
MSVVRTTADSNVGNKPPVSEKALAEAYRWQQIVTNLLEGFATRLGGCNSPIQVGDYVIARDATGAARVQPTADAVRAQGVFVLYTQAAELRRLGRTSKASRLQKRAVEMEMRVRLEQKQ